MTTKEIRAEAHKEIAYIFEELLPEHGLTHRPEQVKLSHFIFNRNWVPFSLGSVVLSALQSKSAFRK